MPKKMKYSEIKEAVRKIKNDETEIEVPDGFPLNMLQDAISQSFEKDFSE